MHDLHSQSKSKWQGMEKETDEMLITNEEINYIIQHYKFIVVYEAYKKVFPYKIDYLKWYENQILDQKLHVANWI